MNRILRIALAVVGLGAALPLGAQDYEALLANLSSVVPDGKAKVVAESVIPGMVLVEYGNGQLLYGSADGRHLLLGDLLEFGADGLVNRTEERRALRRKHRLDVWTPATWSSSPRKAR